MTRQREVRKVAFGADDLSGVVAQMALLTEVGDGWINLVPRISGADDERPTSLRFWTLLGGGGMGLTMGTWVPRGRGQPGRDRPSLGITHVTGRRVASELAARSVPVPMAWLLEQDHPRRGLVVSPPADEPHQLVLEWAIRALSALSERGVIRGWRADVYSPIAKP